MHDQNLNLSAAARQWVNADALVRYAQFGIGELDESQLCSAIDPNAQQLLAKLTPADLCDLAITDPDAASCCLAGIRLLHGQLDSSHKISQSIDTAEGSYWHGIMHRLEGDYGNSKYWYRRVGDHSVVSELSCQFPGYPYQFVDQVQTLVNANDPGGDQAGDLLKQAVIEEWKQLFGYCFGIAFDSA